MRDLVRLLRQRLVVEFARRVGIESDLELILPAEVETRPAHRVVAFARRRMALGEIGGVRGDAIGDDAGLDVVAIRQAEVLFRRDVTQHRVPNQPIIAAPMPDVMWS